MRDYYVYIMTNHSRTLYTGFTSDLVTRVWKHKNRVYDGFTKKYNITQLVYYETTTDVRAAIEREKQIKKWHRSQKVALIGRMNPTWRSERRLRVRGATQLALTAGYGAILD